MGLTTISNGRITAVISDKGAELQSLTRQGIEYIWQGDPAFWAKRAPVLFPFVGRCREDQYTYAGRTYKMGQHGFARDKVFDLVCANAASATYILRSNSETKAVYPFDFELLIRYQISGNALQVTYQVKNTGSTLMFFSIGSHEAYRCPLVGGERFEDYRISFGANEKLDRYYLEDGLVSRQSEPFIDFGQALSLRHSYFEKSVAVLKKVRSNKVTLKSDISGHGVEVEFDGFTNVGLWQPKNAPFMAIEPWMGISDSTSFVGDLPLKEDIVRINTGADRTFTHKITLF